MRMFLTEYVKCISDSGIGKLLSTLSKKYIAGKSLLTKQPFDISGIKGNKIN